MLAKMYRSEIAGKDPHIGPPHDFDHLARDVNTVISVTISSVSMCCMWFNSPQDMRKADEGHGVGHVIGVIAKSRGVRWSPSDVPPRGGSQNQIKKSTKSLHSHYV
jgi:hypothetical protein